MKTKKQGRPGAKATLFYDSYGSDRHILSQSACHCTFVYVT